MTSSVKMNGLDAEHQGYKTIGICFLLLDKNVVYHHINLINPLKIATSLLKKENNWLKIVILQTAYKNDHASL